MKGRAIFAIHHDDSMAGVYGIGTDGAMYYKLLNRKLPAGSEWLPNKTDWLGLGGRSDSVPDPRAGSCQGIGWPAQNRSLGSIASLQMNRYKTGRLRFGHQKAGALSIKCLRAVIGLVRLLAPELHVRKTAPDIDLESHQGGGPKFCEQRPAALSDKPPFAGPRGVPGGTDTSFDGRFLPWQHEVDRKAEREEEIPNGSGDYRQQAERTGKQFSLHPLFRSYAMVGCLANTWPISCEPAAELHPRCYSNVPAAGSTASSACSAANSSSAAVKPALGIVFKGCVATPYPARRELAPRSGETTCRF